MNEKLAYDLVNLAQHERRVLSAAQKLMVARKKRFEGPYHSAGKAGLSVQYHDALDELEEAVAALVALEKSS